eukprot:CAMPEP_0201117964 /NCGR_PEP_ID=MMETSP0850-20130426/2042_1 /ASSEMBLY_ACC=CAM_ASM_000622 /TAXON_ID=183588 /ORGANISM="Pseudo-nitzschia fraudulenta, Strain WWA7" /LENGTH=193 /DNA_ID=CAMNT_0047382793 /DNA_START=376 /DNA_END=957 /DNA_ORIENTATION=+
MMSNGLLKLFAILAIATGGAFGADEDPCKDLTSCSRCLKGIDDTDDSCGWFANTDGVTSCMAKNECTGNVNGKCYIASNDRKTNRDTCGQSCESQSGCESCLAYNPFGGRRRKKNRGLRKKRGKSGCAYLVSTGEAPTCVARSKCKKVIGEEEGPEEWRCIKGRKVFGDGDRAERAITKNAEKCATLGTGGSE